MKTIGVACPFTKKTDLLIPEKPFWIGSVYTDDERGALPYDVVYVPKVKVDKNGLQAVVGILLESGVGDEEIAKCLQIMQKHNDIRWAEGGEWLFIRYPNPKDFGDYFPQGAPFRADIVLARANGTREELLERIRAAFEEYYEAFEAVLYAERE